MGHVPRVLSGHPRQAGVRDRDRDRDREMHRGKDRGRDRNWEGAGTMDRDRNSGSQAQSVRLRLGRRNAPDAGSLRAGFNGRRWSGSTCPWLQQMGECYHGRHIDS